MLEDDVWKSGPFIRREMPGTISILLQDDGDGACATACIYVYIYKINPPLIDNFGTGYYPSV